MWEREDAYLDAGRDIDLAVERAKLELADFVVWGGEERVALRNAVLLEAGREGRCALAVHDELGALHAEAEVPAVDTGQLEHRGDVGRRFVVVQVHPSQK